MIRLKRSLMTQEVMNEHKKELCRVRSRRYYLRHKKDVLKRQRSIPVSEARKIAKQNWEKSEKGKTYRALQRFKRRALSKNLNEIDTFVLQEAYSLSRERERHTSIKWEVDHIIPLSKGGDNACTNIQVVPMIWNRRKHNRNTDKYDSATRR